MRSNAQQPSSKHLQFARHLVGMMILALASPYIHYSQQPIATWFGTWTAPLIISALAYGLYALFFTSRAKAAWPRNFLILAWTCVVLTVASPYIEQLANRQPSALATQQNALPPQSAASSSAQAEETPPLKEVVRDRFGGVRVDSPR